MLLALVRHERDYRASLLSQIMVYNGEGTNRQCVSLGNDRDFLPATHAAWECKVYFNGKFLGCYSREVRQALGASFGRVLGKGLLLAPRSHQDPLRASKNPWVLLDD